MQKLYRKRAKYYHSSDEEVPEEAHIEPAAAGSPEDPASSSGIDGEASVDADAKLDDELGEDGPHQGITKQVEGSRAFKLTFSKIMKKKLPNEPLDPVLSAHKSLVAEKFAEEATEYKAKEETKRLKQYNLFADKEAGWALQILREASNNKVPYPDLKVMFITLTASKAKILTYNLKAEDFSVPEHFSTTESCSGAEGVEAAKILVKDIDVVRTCDIEELACGIYGFSILN